MTVYREEWLATNKGKKDEGITTRDTNAQISR